MTGTIHPNGHQDDLGLLAGSNAGRILNCIASGTVMGDNRIGGLVGINETGGELVAVPSPAALPASIPPPAWWAKTAGP